MGIIWPSSDIDFWKISNKDNCVTIKWSHDCFLDYRTLAYRFYLCGYETFAELAVDIIKSNQICGF